MDIIEYVAATPGHVACLSRGARPRNCLNLTYLPTYLTQNNKKNNNIFAEKLKISGRVQN